MNQPFDMHEGGMHRKTGHLCLFCLPEKIEVKVGGGTSVHCRMGGVGKSPMGNPHWKSEMPRYFRKSWGCPGTGNVNTIFECCILVQL